MERIYVFLWCRGREVGGGGGVDTGFSAPGKEKEQSPSSSLAARRRGGDCARLSHRCLRIGWQVGRWGGCGEPGNALAQTLDSPGWQHRDVTYAQAAEPTQHVATPAPPLLLCFEGRGPFVCRGRGRRRIHRHSSSPPSLAVSSCQRAGVLSLFSARWQVGNRDRRVRSHSLQAVVGDGAQSRPLPAVRCAQQSGDSPRRELPETAGLKRD